jgi:carbonic anhydrase
MKLPALEPSQHDLPPEEFGTMEQLLGDIGHSDQPVAVMLTCWELGSTPDQVSHALPGEIMVVQNLGGVLRGADMPEDGMTLASVAYALAYPNVRHIIVCGHTECKTLRLLVTTPSKGERESSRKLLEPVRKRMTSVYKNRPTKDWLRIIAQENVLQQLANLRSHAEILSRLSDGSLILHGWLRDDQMSTISAFDPSKGQFAE